MPPRHPAWSPQARTSRLTALELELPLLPRFCFLPHSMAVDLHPAIKRRFSRFLTSIGKSKPKKIDKMQPREATHAGSWYSGSQSTLARQLDQWLALAPGELENVGSLPVPGARIIIAPYVLENIARIGSCHFLSLIFPGTRATHTPDLVPLTHTRPGICRRRKLVSHARIHDPPL